ncbi:Mitochondrial Rho GTPase 1 [Halotydeus destructor]|nr:Mitochondrial Rho GTPase 1 [Halotydeus destructor]
MAGRNRNKDEVRILLVGDPGVGKTSLIFALVSEEFSEDVPPRAEEITIPPDVTPEKVTTEIVDYSAQEQTSEHLNQEISKASVICVVYSVEDDDTIDRITTYWLPVIRDQLGEDHKTPVVLVGNKTDLVEYSSLDLILPVMNQYSEVETCVECSAKNLKNIAELFYYAQKAVLHPTSPLYNAEDRDLTARCKKALGRIFKLCDDDNDGILSDDELNAFQRKCFGSPLQDHALDDVKSIVKRTIPDGIFDEGLTLPGFLFLHTLFIQRGRHETTWTVLRTFGYNTEVILDETYLKPDLEIPKGCSVELTTAGYKFLSTVFSKYDSDGDSALCPSELESLFAVCSMPNWFDAKYVRNTVETNELGWVTQSGFMSMWTLMTHVEPHATLELLAHFGYNVHTGEENQLSAVQVTRDKRVDLQRRQTNRNVFSCHVIGPQGAGKSSFMKGFLRHDLDKQRLLEQQDLDDGEIRSQLASPGHQMPNYAVNSVTIYGQEKYLVCREVDIFTIKDKLSEPELLCDVVCLMFDLTNPRSFEYIARIYLKHFNNCKLPILVLGAKADQTAVRQEYILQPEEFCAKYKLPKPHVFTVNTSNGLVPQEVYIKLGTMAAYPNLRRLVHVLLSQPSTGWVGGNLLSLQQVLPETTTIVRAGIGLATLAIAGLFAIRIFKTVSR